MASRNSRDLNLEKRELGKALGLIYRNIEGHGKNMVHEIHVFNGNIFRNRNSGRREIHDAPDARFNQVIGGTLGSFGRSGDDSYFYLEFADFFFKPARTDDLQTGDFLANLEGIAIKGSHENKPATPENAVSEQCPPQIADADQRDIPCPVDAKRLFDGGQQILNIISNASHAEFTKISQIFSNLRRIYAASTGQAVGRYDGIALLKERLQNLYVDSQSLNRGARYVGAFQNDSKQ